MSDSTTSAALAAQRLRERFGPEYCERLAAELSPEYTLALQEYVGPKGGHGYRDTSTGKIIYGDRPSGGRGGGPAPARKPVARHGPSLPDAPDEEADARAFAQFYADCINALVVAGADPEEVIADAVEELEGTGWTLAQDRRGFYRPADESHDSEESAGAEEFTLSLYGWELATDHGIGEVWQGQSGRWFTKRKDGRTVPARDPNKKDEPKSARGRVAARAEKGVVDRQKLGERLAKHVGAGEDDSPSDYQKGRGRAAARMFLRHHGENAAHRVEDLADTLEAALAKVQGDDWKADRARTAIKGQLQKLHATLDALENPQPAKEKPAKKAGASGATSSGVLNVPTEALKVDPERFQYKLNTDSSGVTQELKAVKTFNPDFAGVLSVWKDPEDGETYVVNGHHRHELAARLGHPKLAVRYVQAGSAKEARAVGALVNIAEGRGTAIDAAKFMRDMGVGPEELANRGVSMKGKLAADAAALTKLSDRQFDRLARGLLDEGKALAVARHLESHDLQDQLFGMLEKREESGKDLPLRVVEEMAREMASTPTTSKTEKSLFGDIESEESLFVPRNEVKAHVRNELAREMNDFLAVSSKRRAERVGGAGNVLDTDKNKEIAEKAGWAKDTFDQLVNRKGVISDAINKGAEEYSKAKTRSEKDAAKQRAVEEVRRAVQAELGGVKPGDRGGEAAAGGGASGGEGAADARGGDTEPVGLSEPTFNPEAFLKIAADSVGKLRKQDVFRVLESAPAEHLEAMAKHIHDARPDLQQEVGEVAGQLKDERASGQTFPKEEDLPAPPKSTGDGTQRPKTKAQSVGYGYGGGRVDVPFGPERVKMSEEAEAAKGDRGKLLQILGDAGKVESYLRLRAGGSYPRNALIKAMRWDDEPAPIHHSEDVSDALKRYDARDSLPAAKGALFGGDDLRSREGFARLPDGAEVVITEGRHRGKVGRIRHEESLSGDKRITAAIDGEDGTTPVSHSAVEPMRPEQSWRTEAGAAPKNQTGMFGDSGTLPTGQSESAKASSAIAGELNAMARGGADRGEIRGVPVERIGVGRYRVSVGGKKLEGDHRQAADWIAAESGKVAPKPPTPDAPPPPKAPAPKKPAGAKAKPEAKAAAPSGKPSGKVAEAVAKLPVGFDEGWADFKDIRPEGVSKEEFDRAILAAASRREIFISRLNSSGTESPERLAESVYDPEDGSYYHGAVRNPEYRPKGAGASAERSSPETPAPDTIDPPSHDRGETMQPLPALTGSEKQVAWAAQIRDQMLADAPEFARKALADKTDSRFWIDNRTGGLSSALGRAGTPDPIVASAAEFRAKKQEEKERAKELAKQIAEEEGLGTDWVESSSEFLARPVVSSPDQLASIGAHMHTPEARRMMFVQKVKAMQARGH